MDLAQNLHVRSDQVVYLPVLAGSAGSPKFVFLCCIRLPCYSKTLCEARGAVVMGRASFFRRWFVLCCMCI